MGENILPFPSHIAVWRRGAELAFSMLHEIKGCDLDETACECEFRDNRPQRNVVAAYLAKLKDVNDSRVELAFAAMLTDHIASAMHAGTPSIGRCQLYGRMPIRTEPWAQEERP